MSATVWRSIATALLVAAFGSATPASAATTAGAPCLEEASPLASPLECTANDTGLTNTFAGKIYDSELDPDCAAPGCTDNDPGTLCLECDTGCISPDDTVTFDLYGDLQATATARYDIGIYIAESGGDALFGDACNVSTLAAPQAFEDDGDSCGDITKTRLEDVFVGKITVACTDFDGSSSDGLLSISSCSAWDQNKDDEDCSGTADALPGTSSKCSCGFLTVPEIPVTPNLCEGTDCDDGFACNGAETCDPATGDCIDDTAPPGCTLDANVCTDQECPARTVVADRDAEGCVTTFNTDPCGDSSTGECDGADVCDGAGNCSANHVGDGASCGDDGNVCTTDTCSDGACAHPAGNGGTVCRTTAGVCDVEETCTGDSADCPADGFDTGSICRTSAGACDPQELCNGLSASCPADGKSTAECRASGGVCDPAEVCDGVANDCPNDGKSTAECRGSNGACDLAEVCDGVNDACPADAKSTAECRGSNGECDVAESCDGAGDDCPADGFAQASTSCDGDSFSCTDDACDGEGHCVSTPSSELCTSDDVCVDGACDPENAEANSQGCVFELDVTNEESCVLETCRTAGFWKTHARVTQGVIDFTGCLEVCGEVIDSTGDGADSALEAMCVNENDSTRLQLVRQLTATALNCVISTGEADCEHVSIGSIFESCNAACAGGATNAGNVDCVRALDCFNNGGQFDAATGFCMLGTCDGVPQNQGGIPCNGSTNCGVDSVTGAALTCVPTLGNCHDQAAPNPELGIDVTLGGAADSPKSCNAAAKNNCLVIPVSSKRGEPRCQSGTISDQPESCGD